MKRGTSWRRRRGTATILGALIMFAMLFTAGTSYFMSVNRMNLQYDQALVGRVDSQQTTLSENLTVITKLTGSNHLAYYVNNSGINSNMTSTFLFDSSGNLLKCVGTGLPNTCGNSSPTLPIVVNAGKGSPLIDTGYTYSSGTVVVMVITKSGDSFTGQYPDLDVISLFGRTGAITASSGDYSCSQITNAFCINPSSAQTINYGAAAVQTILKMASSPTADPFVIQNSAGNSVWDVDTTGSLAGGSVPWARLTSFPSACAANYFVQGIGTTLTCTFVPQHTECSTQFISMLCINPSSSQTITYGAAAVQTILKMASSPTADPFVIQNSAGSAVWDISTSGSLTTGSVPWAQLTSLPSCSGNQFAQSPSSSSLGCVTVPVPSVFGRTGLVTAQSGDYSCSQITSAFCITPSSSQTITYGAAAVQTILKMASSPTADPFVIQNSAGSAVWDISTSGSLTTGSVPWAQLTSYPTACATGSWVSALAGNPTCTSLINNIVTSQVQASSTSFTNVPGLSFTLSSNTNYQFQVGLLTKRSSAGAGEPFAVASLPSGTTFTACMLIPTSTTGIAQGCTSGTGTAIVSPTLDKASSVTDVLAIITGTVQVGSSGGTFQIQAATSTTAQITYIEANSWIQAQVSTA